MDNNNLEGQIPGLVADIVGRIGKRFKFGPYEVDDIQQEAYIWAMEALPKYDGRTTLRAFIYHVVYTRCCNLKRKHYERRATPCERCPLSAYCKQTDTCQEYSDRMDCEYWRGWISRNEQKKALNLSFAADCPPEEVRSHVERIEDKDLLEWISDRVQDTRGFSILMRGGHLSQSRYNELIEDIRECLS